MSNRIPIYLVLRPTGLFSREKVELTVTVGQKLTRSAADELAAKTPGDFVQKVFADK